MSRSRKTKIGIAAGIIVVLIVAMTMTKGGRRSKDGMPVGQEASATVVKVERPLTGDVILITGLTGTVEPPDVAHIYAEVAGDVTAVYVRAGDTVTQGQVLSEIDIEQVEMTKNSMDFASVSLPEAQNNLKRMQTLYSGGDLPEQEYEQYVSTVKSAQLQYESVKLVYEGQVQYSSITAPINGKIESFDVEMYDRVSQSQDSCVIAGEGEDVVSFYVTQCMMQNANVGDELEIQKNGAIYKAYINEVNSIVDMDTGPFKVKARIEDTQEIAPGSTVELDLVTEWALETMVVPIDAVYYSGGDAYVYLYQDGTASTAQVEIGLEDKEHAQILSGLSADDVVVSTWSFNLYEGAEVRLRDEAQSEEIATSGGEYSKNAKSQTEQEAQPMGLTRLVLKHPVATVMALLRLLVFGISSIFNVALEQMPDTGQPMLIIMTSYSGAGPEDIDELVTQPIENQVRTIEGVKSMSSIPSENRTMIILEYDYGTDMDDAYNDLSQGLDVLSRQLPDDAETSVMETSNNAGTTMILSISNPSQEDLYDYVDQTVVSLLEQIFSVAEVEVMGGKSEHYKIELQSDETAQYQVTMSDVSTVMSTANPSYPSGDAVSGKLELLVSTPLEHEAIEALKEIPITTSSEKIVCLEDIARVYEVEESRGGILRYNGEGTIPVSIIKQQSNTAMDASSGVQEVIENLEADDGNLNIRIVRDSADSILSSLKDVALTLVLAAVISTIIILIFFGDHKASLIVGSSIPASILVSLIPMTSAGFFLDIITMSGLVLGVDMMADNSIVVLESCFRAIETEEDRGPLRHAKASLSGTNIAPQSTLGSIVTICAAFLPLVFLQGMSGQMFSPMECVIVFRMRVFFLSATIIVPLTCMTYKPQERMQAPMSRPMGRIQNGHRRIMPGLLKYKVTIMIASVIIVIATYSLASGMETELMVADDTGTVSVSIGTRPELLSENADVILTQAEEIVKGHPDVESYMSCYNNDSGTITAYLRDDRDMSTDETVEQWETRMADLDNRTVTVEASLSVSFMSRSRGYEVILNGTDYDGFQEVSNRIVAEITARDNVMNAHSSIENTAPVVTVKVDPVLAAAEGLTASQIGSQVKQMMDGEEVTTLDMDGREVSVMAEYPEDEYRAVSQTKDIILSKPFEGYMALMDVAEIYYKDSPASISKTDKAYEMTITAGHTGRSVQSTIDSEATGPSLSAAIKRGVNSVNRMMQEEFATLYQAIVIAVFLVFVVLSVQFESSKFSLTVMTTISFSLMDSLDPLQIAGVSISMTSILGFLTLVGTVVNNDILYVDIVNQYCMTMDLKTFLIEAGATRLRLTTATSLTTILSMIPMALAIGDGGSTTQGLAIVNIGGLSVDVAVVLFTLPIYCALMNGDKKRAVLDI